MDDDAPNLFSLFLLWIWKQKEWVVDVLAIVSTIITLTIPIVYGYYLFKEVSWIVGTPIFFYLCNVGIKYIEESIDQAKKINRWRSNNERI